MGTTVTGPKVINKRWMYRYCWPGCLTVMYDAEKVGLLQIHDIKKNNDYAMWLKLCEKVNCYLLDEVLAKYRRGRKGSISTNNIVVMIEWHYRLFRYAQGVDGFRSVIYTVRNMVYGFYKKCHFVKKG